jgi:hypothetical protein
MRFGAAIILAACAAASASAYAPPAEILARGGIATAMLPRQKSSGDFFKRAVAPSTAPSGNYTPSVNQICPALLVRQPSGLLDTLYDGERTWVASRRANAVSYWSSYLNNTALNFTSSGFNLTSFLSNTSNLPNIAIAVSGGGYRAMIHGGALLNAFDARNSSSVAQGTGGILQLATYIAGLSGGSWLVGSLAVNDYPTIFNLTNVWNLEESLVRAQHTYPRKRLLTSLRSTRLIVITITKPFVMRLSKKPAEGLTLLLRISGVVSIAEYVVFSPWF